MHMFLPFLKEKFNVFFPSEKSVTVIYVKVMLDC
jgi:hypothetical protein